MMISEGTGTSPGSIIVLSSIDNENRMDNRRKFKNTADELALTNRQKRMVPKRGIGWCGACDAAKVWDGQRCPVCRKVEKR